MFFTFKRQGIKHVQKYKKIGLYQFTGWQKAVKQMKKSRSSCPEVFCKNEVLKTFAKFTEKHVCWSLFLTEFTVEGVFMGIL